MLPPGPVLHRAGGARTRGQARGPDGRGSPREPAGGATSAPAPAPRSGTRGSVLHRSPPPVAGSRLRTPVLGFRASPGASRSPGAQGRDGRGRGGRGAAGGARTSPHPPPCLRTQHRCPAAGGRGRHGNAASAAWHGSGWQEMRAQSAGAAADLAGDGPESRCDSGLRTAFPDDDASTGRKSRNGSTTPQQDSETAP